MKVFIVIDNSDGNVLVAGVYEKKADAMNYLNNKGFTKEISQNVWVRKNYSRRDNSDLDMMWIEEKEVK